MKIYIDFDNTIVNSVKAFVSRYNQLYSKKVDFDSVVSYSYENLKLSEEEILRGFNSDFFFAELDTYPEVISSLQDLKNERFELVLITRGTLTNITKKINWIEKHHWLKDLFSEYVFLTNTQDVVKIDMSDSVLIDDYRVNHLHSNAKYKYAFKDISERQWFPSEEDGVKVMNSWKALSQDIKVTTTIKKKNARVKNTTKQTSTAATVSSTNKRTKKDNTRNNDSSKNKTKRRNNTSRKVVIE